MTDTAIATLFRSGGRMIDAMHDHPGAEPTPHPRETGI